MAQSAVWRQRFLREMEKRELDMKALSLKAGRGETFIRDILKRDRSPSVDNLLVACQAMNLPLAALFDESTALVRSGGLVEVAGKEYASIGRYDAGFSAGPGSLVDPHAEPLGCELIEAQWLRAVTQAAPEQLAVVRVSGESMEPTLRDGDWILIDRTQTRVNREGIYALLVGDLAWVKRLSLNLREKLVRIISDNPTVPMQEIEETELHLIGRVISLVGRKVA